MEDYTTKTCTKCGQTFPATSEYFHRKSASVDGLNPHCRECRHQHYKLVSSGEFVRKQNFTETHRTCQKCGMELPATPEYFYGNKASPDGLYSVCKTCRDDISRKWYEANREQKAELSRQWYQRNVEKAREQNRRYNEANKSRRAARAKLYYRTNKQQINEQNRKWRQNNPTKAQMIVERYRARKQSLPDTFTAEQWIACLEYHHYCCAVCGNQLRDLFGSIVPHADHWIPLSLDECPGTVAENMVCLCSDCNLSKNAKMPDIWLRSRVSTRKANEILARIAAYFEWVICS